MIRMRRKLGLLIAAAALAAPSGAQEIQQLFDEGVDLLRRGRNEEALAKFNAILAADPSNEDAYELWKDADYEVWLDLLTANDELALLVQRLSERATLGRRERADDSEAIKALISTVRTSEDAIERRRAIRQLGADHGEYAVPRLLYALADAGDEEWRVRAMHALTELGMDAVPPLIEALATEDAFQRRNVALVLGYISDPRAAGELTALSQSDPDGSVVAAAAQAAQRCGSSGDALALLLEKGDAYHHGHGSALPPTSRSAVVWEWRDGDLAALPVPGAIYGNEMSKKAYYRALGVDPSSLAARAGIARAAADIAGAVAALDDEELAELAQRNLRAAYVAGPEALDLALQWSVETRDADTGVRVLRALTPLAREATHGLRGALASGEGSLMGEAAVALGQVAWAAGGSAGADVVAQLAQAAGREIARVAAIIDPDRARGEALAAALAAEGVLVNLRSSGASGMAMIHAAPGLDVVLLGDGLTDLTLDAVLAAIATHPRTEGRPVFLVTSRPELAELYSGRVAGSITGPDELSSLQEAFESNLEGDRAEADALSRRAAEALARLAEAGHTDVSPALDSLASTLGGRPDEVAVPAMRALAAVGTPDQVGALLAVASDDARSDEARVGAADALAGIFTRFPIEGGQAQGLADVLGSEASLEVQHAAARALGVLRLDPGERETILRGCRVQVTSGAEN